MGIPSYFSHIIQNHSNILSKYKWILNKDLIFHRLYLDCNSILYDAYKNTDYSENFYDELIQCTIESIENYFLTQVTQISWVLCPLRTYQRLLWYSHAPDDWDIQY